MDWPVLRYVDILIGLSVVTLLACTVVTSITQVILSTTFTRSRLLRDSLQDLITQLDPKGLLPHSRYIAELLVRHPLVARDNTILGGWTSRIRAWWRAQTGKLPLPKLNPPDTIQREEIILLLLEAASDDSTLWDEAEKRVAPVRESIRTALAKTGISDPAGTAAAIRKRMILNECERPDQTAQVWRSQAISEVAATDFAGRIHAWYDNTITRTIGTYSLIAKVWASAIALVLVVVVQLDGISVIRRLAQDDKFREQLVAMAEAKTAEKQEPARPQPLDEKAQREQIIKALADLRDPAKGITPPHLVWDKLAQTRICSVWLPQANDGKLKFQLSLGKDVWDIEANKSASSFDTIRSISTAIQATDAPVSVRHQVDCLNLQAQTPDVTNIVAIRAGDSAPFSERTRMLCDCAGFIARIPGMLLAWILISIGAPFWYDMLKKLVGFRSLLAQKDDKDRQTRAQEGAAAKR